MAGYDNTLKGFQKKLKDGGYNVLVGALRAIGRMKDWTEKDRDKARDMARAHFGDAPAGVAAKKAVKKTSVKKASKKTAPKAAGAATRALKKAKRAPKATEPEASTTDPIHTATRLGEALHQQLKTMDLARSLGVPSEEIAKGALEAQKALTNVVGILSNTVAEHLGIHSEAELRGAAAFEQAARATVAASGGNGVPGVSVSSGPVGAPPLPSPPPPTQE